MMYYTFGTGIAHANAGVVAAFFCMLLYLLCPPFWQPTDLHSVLTCHFTDAYVQPFFFLVAHRQLNLHSQNVRMRCAHHIWEYPVCGTSPCRSGCSSSACVCIFVSATARLPSKQNKSAKSHLFSFVYVWWRCECCCRRRKRFCSVWFGVFILRSELSLSLSEYLFSVWAVCICRGFEPAYVVAPRVWQRRIFYANRPSRARMHNSAMKISTPNTL